MSETKDITKEYSNGEVTIVWKPSLCMHSALCTTGLPEVFDPKAQPWINAGGADTERIIEQVKKCPSGALSYYYNGTSASRETEQADKEERLVEAVPNGPLMIHGRLSIKKPDGSILQKDTKTAFCRCGASANKPFCDGSHRKVGFEG